MARKFSGSAASALVAAGVLALTGCSPNDDGGSAGGGSRPAVTYSAQVTGKSYMLFAYGDDSLALWLNGKRLDGKGPLFPVNASNGLVSGKNTVAASVTNKFLGGGFFFYVAVDESTATVDTSAAPPETTYTHLYRNLGTLVSDSTWGYAFRAPAGWEQPAFRDGDWRNCSTYGSMGGTAQARGKGTAAKKGYDTTCAGKWIFNGRTAYYRKAFNVAAAKTGYVKFCANDKITPASVVKVFLNGVAIGNSDVVPPSQVVKVPAAFAAGKNVLAVSVKDTTSGDGAKFLLEAVLDSVKATRLSIVSDSTWLMSENEEAGWNTVGFNDSKWQLAGDMGDFQLRGLSGGQAWILFQGIVQGFTWADSSHKVLPEVRDSELVFGTPEFPDSMFWNVTVRTNVDTVLVEKTPTKAHWVYPPGTVYLRQTFNLTIQ